MREPFEIDKYTHLFIDFDGVIKNSVDIKGQAFKELFREFGQDVMQKVYQHHTNNGGISRFDKIPIYLDYANIPITSESVDKFQEKFSKIVFQQVIDSDWIPGAEMFIKENYYNQKFILISATPQIEMEQILKALNIFNCFDKVYGSPNQKEEVIKLFKYNNKLSEKDILVIGDTTTDLNAALSNSLDFLLIDFNGSFKYDDIISKNNFFKLENFSNLLKK